MKLKILLSLFVLSFFASSTFAVVPADKETSESTEVISSKDLNKANHLTLTKKELRKQKRAAKKQKRFEKRMAKVKDFMEKKGVDFTDPVDKWLWFAIFGWGAAILLSIILSIAPWGFWTVGWLISIVGLAATVCFVIWLLKKFGDM